MLTEQQIKKIKEHLEKSQNPIFFFDNDPDGLCSFLLLKRHFEKGKGVPIKSSPNLSKEYFRKVQELKADYIFILDKPSVSKEFFEEAQKINIPIVWIDHHPIELKIPDFVDYYNPLQSDEKTNEPVTALCYQITKNKRDLWVAVVGCISDRYTPEFYQDFKKENPDLSIESKDASEIYYTSPIGNITKILEFGLKDKTTNVIKMIKYLTKIKTPNEIIEENKENCIMHKRYREINKKYEKILEKAKKQKGEKLIFFKYSGNMSISSELSSELQFLYPEKIIFVAYLDNSKKKVNLSGRGEKVREITIKALENLEDATGGGHEKAVGAKIKIEDIDKFEKKLKEIIKE